MQGDFSILQFDPRRNERPVGSPADGVLRNLNGVLHQQGRVTLDADSLDAALLDLDWQGQTGRDIIGAGVCAVPAAEPAAFRVDSAFVSGGAVIVKLRPGRAWADGILTRLAGLPPDPLAPVQRLATPFEPPVAPPPGPIGDGVRDAVILEVSEESLHAFQYPERLLEAALGGPDTGERAFVNFRIRLLRLGAGEDCQTIADRLRDDPAGPGHLSATLAPVVAIAGDCPVVGGGGYTGFEHCLYRIEVATTPAAAPARFKWSQWNGGLVGRGRVDATTTPNRVLIDAGRPAIIHSGLTEFYLEALEYDTLLGAWQVVYGSMATLNSEHELELAAPASFGTLPATTEPVFIRLWNGIADIAAFPATGIPVELRDGIRLAFDTPGAGNYRPGDYWTFAVRAGEIANPAVLIDNAPPTGIVYHRVPLAEIGWTGRLNTDISGTIEDCRAVFPPLTGHRGRSCCTFRVGDGVSSFGDYNSLEEAASHLPVAGGELCLLPGLHRANLRLEGRRAIRIHGCAWRTLLIPRVDTRTQPILHVIDCDGIEVCDLDMLSLDGMAVRFDGSLDASGKPRCRDLRVHRTRMIARTHAIRATIAAELVIANNRLHLLDTVDGRATISVEADDVLIERNLLFLFPFVERPPGRPGDQPPDDPSDPCTETVILYRRPELLLSYAHAAWSLSFSALLPDQTYRALGGIHARAGSERVRILENRIAGGAGNGITLGGDLDAADDPAPAPGIAVRSTGGAETGSGASAGADSGAGEHPEPVLTLTEQAFTALVQDEAGTPLSGVDIFLTGASTGADRSDAAGMVAIKLPPGAYRLAASPSYDIVRVAESRDEAGAYAVITLSRGRQSNTAPGVSARAANIRGFLHQIWIERNDVAMMGLSGIGFALRAGAIVDQPAPPALPPDPRAALLAAIDAVLLNMGLTALLRATDPVRELVIENNRLHDNLRTPFTRAMRAQAQAIGRGGVSLAIVEAAILRANHIERNGNLLDDPACGIFVGYGDNLEMTDNILSDNSGTVEREGRTGLRGGIVVRFAAALTTRLSASVGRHAALRVHDNRVDQPAGRALTAYAFGPVSIANNHFNSEAAAPGGALEQLVGTVLLYNLGGIHRLAMRNAGGVVGATNFPALSARFLPGGETLFDDNFLRHGLDNRTFTSHLLFCVDDLGYDGNTASSYRGDPLMANGLLAADTVRATGARLREDATRTISLMTLGTRMNLTAHNQADHCIVARPVAGPGQLPTIDAPNQVLDPLCRALFGATGAAGHYMSTMLRTGAPGAADDAAAAAPPSAHVDPRPDAAPDSAPDAVPDSASGAMADGRGESGGDGRGLDIDALAEQGHARAAAVAAAICTALALGKGTEASRLARRHGADHPLAVQLAAQAKSGIESAAMLGAGAEALAVRCPVAPAQGASLSGRVVNTRGQGLAGQPVELIRASGEILAPLGLSDAVGGFSAVFNPRHTLQLAQEGLLRARVLDHGGRELARGDATIQFAAGAVLQTTMMVPLRAVPRAAASHCTVIYAAPGSPPTAAQPGSQVAPTQPGAEAARRPPPGETGPAPSPLEHAGSPPPAGSAPTLATGAGAGLRPDTPAPAASGGGNAPAASNAKGGHTPLDALQLDERTGKRLARAHITDVEALLALAPDELTRIAGSAARARKLVEAARALLDGEPPP